MQFKTLVRAGPILLTMLIAWCLLAMAGAFPPTHWVEKLLVFPMQIAVPVFIVVLLLVAVGALVLLLFEWLIRRKRHPD